MGLMWTMKEYDECWSRMDDPWMVRDQAYQYLVAAGSFLDIPRSFCCLFYVTAIMEIVKNLLRDDIPLEQNLFKQSKTLTASSK